MEKMAISHAEHAAAAPEAHHHHAEHATDIELHHDLVAPEALGGRQSELPRNYYRSPAFIGTLVATCLAQISGYLGWVLPANTLSLINLALGPSSNIGSSVLALIGNIIGASAQSIDMLLATNTLNGIAAAGQLSFNVVIGELVPKQQRGTYNAIVLSTSIPFAVFGPPIARAFYENVPSLTFRMSYILGVAINVIAIVLYFFFYHPPTYELLHVNGKSKWKQLKGFDWIGSILFTAGLTIFLIGLNWGGSVYPWSDAHVLGAFFAGIAGLVAFCFWEAYCGLDYPIMPMRLFRNFKSDAIVACASIGAMVYYSGTVIWPTMAGTLFTTSIAEVGWLSCAVGGGLLFGQILAGIGIRSLPKMKWQMTIAGAIMVAFVASLASSTADTRVRTVVFLLIGAAGAGYVENLTLSAITLVWEPEDIGLVAGMMGCIRTAAGALATSMYSSILATELKKYLPQFVGPAATAAGLPVASLPALLAGVGAGSFDAVPGINADVLAAIGRPIKEAYAMSFRTVFLCTLPFGAILLLAAIFYCPNMEDYLTDEVSRKLQGVATEPKMEGKGDEESQVA
ncbi:hypothetical protein LTR91_007420 [Friedmanniomyces endolithicus]|uniref:Major facilitator superfamily (MFS) profile domain-containing protein n=1 Tax=Friedmanniomyces endolithicus TaxID=329885 RepID=A0AAN6QV56_9PEZI|nr:hypothetical protein LTR75_004722 [Friedmanniomyces endolithicus]KAK0814898.1 hypothetical protein LTR59_000653 [Friedmanniomyces endolithicus]KAK0849225.1 hypothetical protein LTR03_005306 [Friedmanniomyces endolithicus]KAK0874270.1 hypothetical protein LTS02_000186 [Friedmanniomyces endolithicus]KAK0884014.1 hypothetical protein LTR87_002235 [Friedmanniomyces endolithicus]